MGWAATGTGALLNGANKFMEAGGTILSGGSFWDGARNGLISAGLNHATHTLENYFEEKRVYKFFSRLRNHYESKTGTDYSLTEKEVKFLESSGKIGVVGKYVGDKTWSHSIDFYEAGFDLKYSFGSSTIDLTLSGNGKVSITRFFDTYDFDPKAWGVRSIINEMITRGYNLYSSGKSFNIIYNAK